MPRCVRLCCRAWTVLLLWAATGATVISQAVEPDEDASFFREGEVAGGVGASMELEGISNTARGREVTDDSIIGDILRADNVSSNEVTGVHVGTGSASTEWVDETTTDNPVNGLGSDKNGEKATGVNEGSVIARKEWLEESTTDDPVNVLESDSTGSEQAAGVSVGSANSNEEWIEETTTDNLVNVLGSDNASSKETPGMFVPNINADGSSEVTTDIQVVGDDASSENTSGESSFKVVPGVSVIGDGEGFNDTNAEWRDEGHVDKSVESENTSAEWMYADESGVAVIREGMESNKTNVERGFEATTMPQLEEWNDGTEWFGEETTTESVIEEAVESNDTNLELRFEVEPGVEVIEDTDEAENTTIVWTDEQTTTDDEAKKSTTHYSNALNSKAEVEVTTIASTGGDTVSEDRPEVSSLDLNTGTDIRELSNSSTAKYVGVDDAKASDRANATSTPEFDHDSPEPEVMPQDESFTNIFEEGLDDKRTLIALSAQVYNEIEEEENSHEVVNVKPTEQPIQTSKSPVIASLLNTNVNPYNQPKENQYEILESSGESLLQDKKHPYTESKPLKSSNYLSYTRDNDRVPFNEMSEENETQSLEDNDQQVGGLGRESLQGGTWQNGGRFKTYDRSQLTDPYNIGQLADVRHVNNYQKDSTDNKISGQSPGGRERSVTLAIVFDSTGSMWDDLVQVKIGAQMIMKTMLEREDKPIQNYVLVPFHDPTVGPVTNTTDHQKFRESLQNITVYGGGDCPEMSVGAIKEALDVSLPNSFIYVFTDATAKDYRKLPDVLKLIQRKKSQVVFVMTGDCGDNKHVGYQVYEKIAATSSGQVFHLNKTNVKEVMEFVKSSLQSRQVNLLAVDRPTAAKEDHSVLVDDTLQEFTVSVSGRNPQIDVVNPAGEAVDQPPQLTPLLTLENVKVVNVQEPEPGRWTVTVTSDSGHSVRSTGKSDFDFTHGFAVVVTDKMAETFYRPLKGSRNSILIQATNMDGLSNLTAVKIVDLKGKEVETLPLYSIRGSPGLYRGKLFIPNNDFFYLAVEGFDKDGTPVKRISSAAISSQTPEPPIVHMVDTQTARIKTPTDLNCYVESLVPFTVAWFKDGVPSNPSKQYKQSAEVIWHMKSTEADAEGNYTCQANNLVGRSAQSTLLTVTGSPPLVTTDAKVFAKPNGVAVMNCLVKSDFEFSLAWSQQTNSIEAAAAGNIESVSIPLQNDFKTKILSNGSLVISYVNSMDEGWYVCSAENKGGTNESRVYLVVNEPVRVKVRPERFEFQHGGTFTLSCVASGRPEPTLRWLKDGQDLQGNNPRADYIEQRNGLDLRIRPAREEDEGEYQCLAENGVDRDDAVSHGMLVEAPTVIAEEGTVLGKEGKEVLLKCLITGTPAPVVSWWRVDRQLHTDTKYQVLPDGSLQLSAVDMSDQGEYTCSAENQLGSEKDFVLLEVGTAPHIIQLSTDPVSVDIGTSGLVPCFSSGYPEPTVSWSQVNSTRPLSDKFVTSEQGSLLITGITIEDEGDYICTAENTFGKDRALTHVKVTGIVKPVWDAVSPLSPETTLKRGERLELRCPLTLGNPPPVITWYRDGEVLDQEQLVREGMVAEGEVLVVGYTQQQHRGLYECVASNVGGTASQATSVIVLEPPGFEESETEPRVFKVKEGSALNIRCEAGGFPKPFVTWEKDRLPLLPSQTVYKSAEDNSLVITEATEEDTGTYVCTAENAAGAKQKAAVISVLVPPVVLETSDPVTTTEGSLVTLECLVYAVPEASISWYRDDILVTSYRSDAEFLENNAIIRFVVNISDTGSYICVASNEAGSATAGIPLVVMVPPSIHPPQDERYRVTAGQNVTLDCHVSGHPMPSVAWSLNGVPLDVSGDHKLAVVGVAERDAGNYVCDAENEVGISQKIFYLQVNVPPKILEDLPTRVKLMEGEDYSVPCTASGNPAPIVGWRRDGHALLASGMEDMLVLEDGTLVLVNVSDNYTGIYSCTAENGEGSDQKNYIVEVLVPPTMPDTGETKLEVAEGRNVVMTCPSVEAIPSPHYKWMKEDHLLVASGKTAVSFSPNHRTLMINNSRPVDAGRYTCIATNLAGRDNATFKLAVWVVPQFRSSSYRRELRVLQGHPVEMNCAALGQPQPRFSWKKNNIPVTPHTTPGVVLSLDKQTLYIHKARLHDTGLFQCAASNVVGRRDRDFKVTVLVPPELEGPPEEDIETARGNTIILQCPLTGTPEPAIRWRKLGSTGEIQETKNIILSNNKKILEISNVRPKDNGVYVCEGASEAGFNSKRFNVTVLEPPFIAQGELSEDMKVAEGKQARLVCTAKATPKADVVWLHNGHLIETDNAVSSSGRLLQKTIGADENILSILDVGVADAGKYTCLASNEVGMAEKNYRLKVLVAPRLARPHTERNTIESIEGLPITIRCPLEGHPSVDIQWMKDSQLLEAGDMLRISNGRPEHAGNYTCVAGNPAGNVSTSFQLDVLVPPSANGKKDKEDVYKLTVNETLRLVCNVSGHPLPNIVWLKGVTPIAALKWLNARLEDFNRTLIVPRVTREHTGQYSCLAINMAGTTEIAFSVQVQEPPKMDDDNGQMTSNFSVKLHRRLVLKCPLSGSPQPSITWYKDGTPVKSGNSIHLSSDGKQLHLMQALKKNEGDYDCVAQNSAGTKKLRFTVDVEVPAEWSAWSDWSECSAICGAGEQVRVRFCHSADWSSTSKESCQGESEEWRECKLVICQIDGGWSDWSEWTSCSESCGRATRRRYRKCDNPSPAFGGQPCLGSDGQQEYCNMPPCPVDGKWSQWTDWSDCSASCGQGTKQRTRQCNNPKPAYNGGHCDGPELETVSCNLNRCPQHGQWATWGQWTPCSTTCGPGVKKRHRICGDPPPKYGGSPCAGENLQIDKCVTKSCDRVPLLAALHVRGNLNGEKLNDNHISARVSDFGPKRTVTANVEDILKEQPGWFPYLGFLLAPVSWNTAYEMDMANNGYSLTNGNFRQHSQIEFATGHQMVLRHVGRGLDDEGALQVDIEVEGSIPIVQAEASVLIEPFEEDYVQTGPNSLFVSASNSLKVNGQKLPYTWNNTVSYNNMQGTMPYLVEKLTTSDIAADYDARLQQLKCVMSTEIGRKYDSNRCLEGFESDESSPYCRDVDECEDPRLHRCHPSQMCENLLGSYRCYCQPGFKSAGVGQRCLDVNECVQVTNVCSHECLNIRGSYRCLCPPGLSLLEDGKTCTDTKPRSWDDNEEHSNMYDFYEPPSNPDRQMYFRDRGSNHFQESGSSRQYSLTGVTSWSCPGGFRAVSGICLDIDECNQMPSVCSAEQTCLNVKGSYKCLETPCPRDFVKNFDTGTCVKRCDRAGVYCADGALLSETLSYNILELDGDTIEPYEDLMQLNVQQQNQRHQYKTRYRIVENEKGKPFRVRLENGLGILYTQKQLLAGKIYRITVLALTYEESGKSILYTTRFVTYIQLSND